MVSGDCILRKKTKQRMLTLSHYRFRQILTLKAKEFGTTLRVMGEEYTTKTRCCGKLNDRVGGSKTYTCIDPACGYRADRDVNGARNVFIKGVMEKNKRLLGGLETPAGCSRSANDPDRVVRDRRSRGVTSVKDHQV